MARPAVTTPPAIYVSSSRYDRRHLVDALPAQHDVSIVCNESGKRLSEEQLIATRPPNCVGIIAGLEPLSARVLDHYGDVKVIARLGTGMDTVDLAAASRRGISVLGTPDATTDAVAELTIGLMIAALRGVVVADRAMRNKDWSPVVGGLVKGRTIGIIGFGRIGRRVAELVEAFGARVRFFDPMVHGNDPRQASMHDLLATSDVVTLHAPLTDETSGLLGAREISQLKQGCLVVNVARGGLLDEAALADALRAGRVRAALDCFVDEPYIGALSELQGVVLSAHMGSLTEETRTLMEVTAARQLVVELQKHGVL